MFCAVLGLLQWLDNTAAVMLRSNAQKCERDRFTVNPTTRRLAATSPRSRLVRSIASQSARLPSDSRYALIFGAFPHRVRDGREVLGTAKCIHNRLAGTDDP